jgi:hypothetical protein
VITSCSIGPIPAKSKVGQSFDVPASSVHGVGEVIEYRLWVRKNGGAWAAWFGWAQIGFVPPNYSGLSVDVVGTYEFKAEARVQGSPGPDATSGTVAIQIYANQWYNLSFETAGAAAGDADWWAAEVINTAETFDTFGPDPRAAVEMFARGWSSNEAYRSSYAGADFTAAVFTGSQDEGFETGWANTTYVREWAAAAGADPTTDALEAGWYTNEAYRFAYIGPDFTAAAAETWDYAGYVDDWTGAAAVAASFDGAAPEAVEDFEEIAPEQAFTVNVGASTLHAVAHGLVAGRQIQVRTTGHLPGLLDADTVYYVLTVDADNFQLSLFDGGSAVSVPTAGAGTHYVRALDGSIYWNDSIAL